MITCLIYCEINIFNLELTGIYCSDIFRIMIDCVVDFTNNCNVLFVPIKLDFGVNQSTYNISVKYSHKLIGVANSKHLEIFYYCTKSCVF